MAEAHCPASCGELLQGWILGGEKLVSCPINWYSHVLIEEGEPLSQERSRMRMMLEHVQQYLEIEPIDHQLKIEYQSSIPIGKGLASSTADIAATAQAVARFYGVELSEQEIAALCVTIEPTDSTIFSSLTLFDHQTAQTQLALSWSPNVKLLLLESPEVILTEDFHKRDRLSSLKARQGMLSEAWELLRIACRDKNPQYLGEAATLSALASQDLLPKPGFHDLYRLVEQGFIYGVNVAHSGSVVGVLYDDALHDKAFIYDWLIKHQLNQFYPLVHEVSMTQGGVR